MATSNTFDSFLNKVFESSCGAYTSITQAEIDKQTYNVKVCIRDLLVSKLGRVNIPKANSGSNQTIHFLVCPHTRIPNQTIDLQCKFSKPDKDEMSLYLSRELFPKSELHSGDYWYIYFKENAITPIFGLLTAYEWNCLHQGFEDEAVVPTDPEDTSVKNEITGTLSEVAPPELKKRNAKRDSGVAAMYRFDFSKQKKNLKIGKLGEQFVLLYEKARLIAAGRTDLAERIDWVANNYDGFGYDIISFDIDVDGKYKKIFIEVKTTQGDINQPFFISKNEIAVSQILCDDYYIYRVFNISDNAHSSKFYKVCGAVEKHFQLVPIQFQASLESQE